MTKASLCLFLGYVVRPVQHSPVIAHASILSPFLFFFSLSLSLYLSLFLSLFTHILCIRPPHTPSASWWKNFVVFLVECVEELLVKATFPWSLKGETYRQMFAAFFTFVSKNILHITCSPKPSAWPAYGPDDPGDALQRQLSARLLLRLGQDMSTCFYTWPPCYQQCCNRYAWKPLSCASFDALPYVMCLVAIGPVVQKEEG